MQSISSYTCIFIQILLLNVISHCLIGKFSDTYQRVLQQSFRWEKDCATCLKKIAIQPTVDRDAQILSFHIKNLPFSCS